MRCHLFLAAARYTTLLSCALAVGYSQEISSPPDAKARIDEIFAQFNRNSSPGCVVGAAIAGVPVVTAAYGMADLEHNVPLTPQSVLEAGSVSKQFTAGAVLLLAQQGKLSLDDPVRKYIPELPDYASPITIGQLIHHTSGIREWGDVEYLAGWPRSTRVYTHAHVLDILSRQRSLNFPPGSDWSYATTGYNLLAILTERVTKKSLQEFTKETMFSPLAMSATQWRDDFQRIVPNRAVGYEQNGDSIRTLMPFENVYGNGGLLTTVGDLLKWNQNFVDAKVGGPSFTRAQQEPGMLNNGQPHFYAAGLFVGVWKGVREVSHEGGVAGYRAWLARYPDQGVSVALLCNTSAANDTDLGHKVSEVYLGSSLHPERVESTVSADPAALQFWAGMYVNPHNYNILKFGVKDGQLQFDGRIPLTAISPNSFALVGEGVRFDFKSNATGKPAGVRFIIPGVPDSYLEKVETVLPSQGDLAAMSGEYVSDEAETTFKVTVQDGGLVIHRRPDATIPLTPAFRDGFSSSIGTIRFMRDTSGRITEMSVSFDEAVWDLRFRRVQ